MIWGQNFNLPGKIQTVPGGELFVQQYLLEQADHYATIEFATDSKINRNIFNSGEARACKTNNCGLFKLILQNIGLKGLTVTTRWMPSHLQETHIDKGRSLPRGITLPDVQRYNQMITQTNRHEERQHEFL